jgi:hypothetical protein
LILDKNRKRIINDKQDENLLAAVEVAKYFSAWILINQ